MNIHPPLYKRFIISLLAIVIGIPTGLNAFTLYNRKFQPVVTDFKVLSLEYKDNAVIASGTLNKREPCELINTNVYEINKSGRHLIHVIKSVGTMSMGEQTWSYTVAPVKYPPPEEVQIVAMHRCGFFTQETVYGSIKIRI